MRTEIAETLATVRCVECRRQAERGEPWRLFFAEVGEVAFYCPRCAEREFCESSEGSRYGQT